MCVVLKLLFDMPGRKRMALKRGTSLSKVIVRADSAEELLSRTREAMQRLDVLDIDGRSIIGSDICLKTL